MRWILVALVLFATAPVFAVPWTKVNYWFGGTPINETVWNPDDTVFATQYVSDLNVSISADADYGRLRAYARTLANSASSVTSSWSDSVTIDAGALNGQSGWLTASLDYVWVMGATGNFGYTMDAFTNLHLASHLWTVRERRSEICDVVSCTITENTGFVLTTGIPGSPPVTSEAPVGPLIVTVPIEFGKSFNLGVDLYAYGQSGEYHSGNVHLFSSTIVDAGNSVYWGGILSVRDANGTDVPYSLSSLSGTDYTRSFAPTQVEPTVPEPGVALLLLIGLAAGSVLRKRSCVN